MKPRRRKFNLTLVILLSLVLGWSIAIARFNPFDPPQTAVNSATEIRGVWITNVNSTVLFLPWEINRALYQLAQLNFNTVYPVVWNRGTSFYPSVVARRVTGHLQDSLLNIMRFGRDVLSEIIKQGHREGLRVIPWFEYGFMAPLHSQLVRRHPDWVTLPQNNSNSEEPTAQDLRKATLPNRIKNKLYRFIKIKTVWLNPFHPDVQNFLEDLVLEVVMKYNLDGIQFDDHLGLPVELGYDRYTLKLYKQEHNGKLPPNNPRDPEWMRWRANKITNFVERVIKRVKSVKPDCLISLAANPQEYAYNDSLQDWKTWLERGMIDELLVQIYRNNQPDFLTELTHPSIQKARQKVPVGIGILSGTFGNSVDTEQIKQQVKEVRDRKLKGISFFYWETLWSYFTPDPPRQRRQVFQDLLSPPN